MTELLVIKIMRESLMTVMLVAAPVLGVGMFVGLLVSIFQTTTSIQEQTLTFVPKMLAIFVTIILLGSWMIRVLINYTNNIFALIGKIGVG
jgi:flagellar biosynthetic protein FliQ